MSDSRVAFLRHTSWYEIARKWRLMALVPAFMLVACATTSGQEGYGGSGMAQSSPVRAAEINTQLGVGYMERGQYRVAMEKLELALQHDPNHVPAMGALALLNEELGNMSRAEHYYRRAARLAPRDGATQNMYGAYLCRTGKLNEAVRRFLTATEDPFYDTPELALTNAGTCALRIPDRAQAETYFRRALEINPGLPEALYHMAELQYQQGDAFRARAFLQRLEAASAFDSEILMLGYRIETALSNYSGAEDYANRLQTRFPDSEEAIALRNKGYND